MKHKLLKRKRGFWLIAIIGIILDQITKFLVVENFANLGDTVPLWEDVFHLTYVINTGAAFSFFRVGNLEGKIQRDSKDRIAISVWESN